MTMPRSCQARVMLNKVLLLGQVAAAAIVLCFLLRFIKFPRLMQVVAGKKDCQPEAGESAMKDIIRAISLLSGCRLFVIRNNCLKKTLLLYFFLPRAGLRGLAVNISVHNAAGKLAGHSWLMLSNKIFLDDERHIRNFAVIYSTQTRVKHEQ